MPRLADAEKDLQVIEANLPALEVMLTEVRRQTGVIESIALANGADPDHGDVGRLRAMPASVCHGIAYALSEAKEHATIVRDRLATHASERDQPPPPAIDPSWQRFIDAFHYARRELEQMKAVLDS